jgi:hypothetical protein
MRIRPKAAVKKITNKLNTGYFLEKHGEKIGASVWGVSMATLATYSIKGNSTGVVPGLAIAGAGIGAGVVMLSRELPKKLVNEPLSKLVGKPRLAQELSKNVKDPIAKSTLYMIANARTAEEKRALGDLINNGETRTTDWRTILRIAKKASINQNNELAKKLYFQLRGRRGIPLNLLDHSIKRITRSITDKKITTNEYYTNQLANSVLPFAVIHAMDVYGVTNKEAKAKIVQALRKQLERTLQKQNFGAEVTAQALMQDMKIIEYGEEFGAALKEVIPDQETSKKAFGAIVENMQHLMGYTHSRISTELFFARIMQRVVK